MRCCKVPVAVRNEKGHSGSNRQRFQDAGAVGSRSLLGLEVSGKSCTGVMFGPFLCQDLSRRMEAVSEYHGPSIRDGNEQGHHYD